MTHTIIFGGTKGMGRVLASRLASKGRHVTVLGRTLPATEDSSPQTAHLACDFGDRSALDTALDQIRRHTVAPNYLVFFQRFRGNQDAWEGEWLTTTTAFKHAVETLAPAMDANGDRAIAIVSSLAGRFVAPDQSAGYHVAKAAVLQLMQYFAVNLGPKGIRVNAVSPGATIKPESADYYARQTSLHKLYGQICPLGRMGTADDVANALEFLCSPMASFINGHNLVVDGGISINSHESLARKVAGI